MNLHVEYYIIFICRFLMKDLEGIFKYYTCVQLFYHHMWYFFVDQKCHTNQIIGDYVFFIGNGDWVRMHADGVVNTMDYS